METSQSRGSGLVGAADCEVVGESVRNFDACIQIGVLGANCVCFRVEFRALGGRIPYISSLLPIEVRGSIEEAQDHRLIYHWTDKPSTFLDWQLVKANLTCIIRRYSQNPLNHWVASQHRVYESVVNWSYPDEIYV